MKLKNKTAIVTGAGRGIGKAIALALAKEGADLVVVSRSLPEVTGTADEAKSLGRRALALKVDVSRQENVVRMVSDTLAEFGKIDILVNNASIQGPIGRISDNPVERWVETISTNLTGTFLCIKEVLPFMMKQRQGKIINLSGGGATSPRPCFSAYAASKTAIVRLTETVAEEVKEYNIQVNAIAPGAVNTRILDEILAAGDAAGEKAQAEAKNQVETGGTSPEKAAALAVFLSSDESNGLTGRLISAVWDEWQNMAKHVTEINSSDLYTLRRITPEG